MKTQSLTLLNTELFEELEAIDDPQRGARWLRAWRVLLRAARLEDLTPAMHFAADHDLLSEEAVEHLASQYAAIQRRDYWTNPTDGSQFAWIAPGPFSVGQERRRAECEGFFLARYPITNAQFQQFLDATDYRPPIDHPNHSLFLVHWRNGKLPQKLHNHPVVWISFVDAMHYCNWAGLALPTEWMWEKAARGPDGRIYPWGDQPPISMRRPLGLANVGSQGTNAVGSFPRVRTPYGCEDMVGNISEWCHLDEGEDFSRTPVEWPEIDFDDPPMMAVRGSCYLRFTPGRMAASHRRRLSAIRRNAWVGFRPAYYPLARGA